MVRPDSKKLKFYVLGTAMNRIHRTVAAALAISIPCYAVSAFAASVSVPVNLVDASGVGKSIGTVKLSDSKKGLVLSPNLKGLPAGTHGFHVHQNPDCGPGDKDGKPAAAMKAGGHLDPDKTGKHEGPGGKGHLGDLPALTVAKDGAAKKSVVAPRLTVAEVLGHALMIHAGGDNYSDTPEPLGGGGARIACGVIPAKAGK